MSGTRASNRRTLSARPASCRTHRVSRAAGSPGRLGIAAPLRGWRAIAVAALLCSSGRTGTAHSSFCWAFPPNLTGTSEGDLIVLSPLRRP